MKAIKLLGGLLLLLIIVVAIALAWVANNINGIAKDAIEQVGSDTLKTEVKVAEVDLSLLSGSLTLKGLTIANPQGFTEPMLFELNEIAVDLEPMSLLDQTIDVEKVLIDGGRVTAEQRGNTTNLQALLKALESEGGQASSGGDSAPSSSGESATPDVLIKVRDFDFEGNSLNFVTEKWGAKEVEAPAIALDNVGGDRGVPPDQLAKAFLLPLIGQLSQSAEKVARALAEDKAREKLAEKEDELKGKIDEKLGSGAADKLKGLFK